MGVIRYTRSAATASWIDARTGLPEVDAQTPGGSVTRGFLTGAAGFRFVNFLEVFANYDTATGDITGHGFTTASGVYRAPSYAGIPSVVFTAARSVRVGNGPLQFTQIIGCRTQSPEKIGGSIFGPLGNILASAVKAFPPIWTEIRLEIAADGRATSTVLRHSLFPSVTFYTRPVIASGIADESGPYVRTPIGGQTAYDGMPNMDRWYDVGWGPLGTGSSGPVTGNPWGMERTVLTGIDPTQPFGW